VLGPIGLAIVVVGVAIGFAGTSLSERATLGDADTRAKLRQAQSRLRFAILVIAAAIAIYLVAREYHHGRLGLTVCAAILAVNSIVVAALKIRSAKQLLSAEQMPRYRTFTIVEALGFLVMFAGVYVYLIR